MTFFERQDKARALSASLSGLFIVAVLLTFLLVHAFVVTTYVVYHDIYGENAQTRNASSFRERLTDPRFFAIDLLAVGGLIVGASLYRFHELKTSGVEGVVKSFGGTPLGRGEKEARDRRLYNVVEEIAIASGTPVPRIYVLEKEGSINACAVGTCPENAAICVTRGALELLTRDELQGVVAHEFSHIVNNDVRLNMRLVGFLFGLELIALVAMWTISTIFESKSSNLLGQILLALFVGILLLIGSVGVFFGNIIRAAISRQRELLADASAVQFTRNPDGIVGALKKIGSPKVGSAVGSPNCAQASHMFFGAVFKTSFFKGIFLTHPKLVDRIKAIDSTFDGTFPDEVERTIFDDEPRSVGFDAFVDSYASEPKIKPTSAAKVAVAPHAGSERNISGAAQTSEAPLTASALYGDWATLETPAAEKPASKAETPRLRIAPRLLEPIPTALDSVLVNVAGARATIYCALLSADQNARTTQTALLRRVESADVLGVMNQIHATIEALPETARLQLVRVATPLVKALSLNEYKLFRKIVVDFCAADGRFDLFEFTVQTVALRELDVFYRLAPPIFARYSKLSAVVGSVRTALACLANEGTEKPGDAEKAFCAGAAVFDSTIDYPTTRDYSLASFTKALNELAHATPKLKKSILEACWRCVLADGTVTERESALLSAVTAALGVPAPVWREWRADA